MAIPLRNADRMGVALPCPRGFNQKEKTMTAALPFLPFSRPTIDEDTIAAVGDVIRSGWLTNGGPQVAAFEAQLSEYFGGRPVRTFNSGTCTMEIALRIAGVGAGDEVITTPISWVATANVILEVGATPVFADIDPVTRNIDLDKLEAAITPRTRAIIPVYLAGLPVDMGPFFWAQAQSGRPVPTLAELAQERGAVDAGLLVQLAPSCLAERLFRALEATRDRPHACERIDAALDEKHLQPALRHRQHDDVDGDREGRKLRRVVGVGTHDHYLSTE